MPAEAHHQAPGAGARTGRCISSAPCRRRQVRPGLPQLHQLSRLPIPFNLDGSFGRGMIVPRHCEGRKARGNPCGHGNAAKGRTGLPRPCGARNDGLLCSAAERTSRHPPCAFAADDSKVRQAPSFTRKSGANSNFHPCAVVRPYAHRYSIYICCYTKVNRESSREKMGQ